MIRQPLARAPSITDVQVGIDPIGLARGLTSGSLTLQNHEIRAGDETLAPLNGVDVASLDASSFVMV